MKARRAMRANLVLALSAVMVCSPVTRSQPLEHQAMCAAGAEKAFRQYFNEDKVESEKLGMKTISHDYQSHYNTKIQKCLILTEKTYVFGSLTGTSINLWDAYERRQYATWLWTSHETKKYWDVPPLACEIAPNYREKKNCTTRDEFDVFVAQYMEE